MRGIFLRLDAQIPPTARQKIKKKKGRYQRKKRTGISKKKEMRQIKEKGDEEDQRKKR